MTHARAILLLFLCAILWSFGGVLIKSIPLHPMAIAGVRSAIAALVLSFIAGRFTFVWTRTQIAASLFFAYSICSFVVATKLTTAANAILLQFTAPIYVALLSGPILNEKITRRDIIALVVMLCGMVVFFLEKISPQYFWGNVVALTSGISFAGMAVCLKRQKSVSIFESLFIGHIVAAIIGIPFLLAGPWPTLQDMGILFVLGVVQLGIPYALYGIAIRYVTALEVSLVPGIEPILNPTWVAIFMGEIPSRFSFVGGSIVIGAVLWHSLGTLRKKSKAIELRIES